MSSYIDVDETLDVSDISKWGKLQRFEPLFDKVLLKRVEAKGETEGGILLPDQSREKPDIATVIAVGEGARNKNGRLIPPTVKVGDKVAFPRYGGSELTLDGVDFVVVLESQLLGIVNDNTIN